MREIALVLVRAIAEHGARAGWSPSPAGPLWFAVRGRPGAQPIIVLQNAGHLPHIETPRALAPALLAPFRVTM